MDPDDLLCYCFHVTHRKVMNYVRIHRPRVASELSECGGAGTGCGWCVPFLKRHFQAGQCRQKDVGIDLSAAEYAQQRQAWLAQRSGRSGASVGRETDGRVSDREESGGPTGMAD